MHITFKCKTCDAYQIKILAELLTDNLKHGFFNVTDDVITLRMFDQNRMTLV